MKRIFSVIFIIILPLISFGQYGRSAKRAALKTRNRQISRFTVRTDFSKSKRYVCFGAGIGISNYFGDLAPRSTRISSDLSYSRNYLSLYHLQRVHSNVNIRTTICWMQLRGDDYSVANISNPTSSDIGRFKRNLSFRNNIIELSSVGIFEILPTDRGYLRRNFLNPYGIIGLSVFRHNPETKTPIKLGEKSDWVDLQPLGTEGQHTGIPGTPRPYTLYQIGVPIGGGIKYRLMDKWDLSLEFCYRFVFTDYLDDVSGRYPSEETYGVMLQQGNYDGISLSNRSAELYASIENEKRAEILKTWKDNSLTNRSEIYLTDGDKKWYRIIGSEYGASPRGNKRRDYWMVTAINLSYIMEVKQKPPKFR
jgi:hypothetical protein